MKERGLRGVLVLNTGRQGRQGIPSSLSWAVAYAFDLADNPMGERNA